MEWIKVSDALPEPLIGAEGKKPIMSVDVLAFFNGGDCYFEVCYYDHEESEWGYSNELGEHPDAPPTHWTPLSSPD